MPDQPGRSEQATVDSRFVLANERTLLAWLRTSLAFVAIGVALVALRHLGTEEDWTLLAAAASCVVGMITAIWAYWHWHQVDEAIRTGRQLPHPTVAPVLVIGVVVIAVTGLIAVVTRL
ncbi:MAG: YidH family protein [Nocardioidaceae bacterium]